MYLLKKSLSAPHPPPPRVMNRFSETEAQSYPHIQFDCNHLSLNGNLIGVRLQFLLQQNTQNYHVPAQKLLTLQHLHEGT